MAEEQLTIETGNVHGHVVLVVAGEIDLKTGSQLRKALLAAIHHSHGPVVVDLGRVTFMDSVGLKVFAEAHQQALPPTHLCVAAPTAGVRRVFNISGLDKLIDIYDSVEAAWDAPTCS